MYLRFFEFPSVLLARFALLLRGRRKFSRFGSSLKKRQNSTYRYTNNTIQTRKITNTSSVQRSKKLLRQSVQKFLFRWQMKKKFPPNYLPFLSSSPPSLLTKKKKKKRKRRRTPWSTPISTNNVGSRKTVYNNMQTAVSPIVNMYVGIFSRWCLFRRWGET